MANLAAVRIENTRLAEIEHAERWRARELEHAAAPRQATAAACLTYMNQFLVEHDSPGMFATLFYGILDTRTGSLEYANAGHNPPYIFSPDGKIRALKDRSGPMLGIFLDMHTPPRLVFTEA